MLRGHVVQEIKEWQAIMDYLSSLSSGGDRLPIIAMDDRATEVRAVEHVEVRTLIDCTQCGPPARIS